MAVLTKEEYFDRLRSVVGDDASDESIKLVEDFTDTYIALEQRDNEGEVERLKEELEKNDQAWAKRYKERFLSGNGGNVAPLSPAAAEQERAASITVEDLFKKK